MLIDNHGYKYDIGEYKLAINDKNEINAKDLIK